MRKRLAFLLVMSILASLAGWAPSRPVEAAAPRVTGCADAHFHPLDPVRVFDSARDVAGGLVGQSPVTVSVAGQVPAVACAVVATLTGAQASMYTYVTAYPAGDSRPTASNLNLQPRVDAADLVTVGLGADRAVTLYDHAGTVRLALDVAGYYSTGAADVYVPLAPTRVLDTASTGTPVGPGQTVTLTPAQLHVPAGADAVLVNLTAVGGRAPTYVSAYPAGAGRPATSDLNVSAGGTRAALASVRISTQGLTLYNNAGAIRLVADIEGWFSPTATGALFSTATQPRVTLALDKDAAQDVTIDGGGAPPAAALFTLTAAQATSLSVERAYPTPTSGSAVPTVSNVNVDPGVDTPNLVAVALSPTGSVRVLHTTGATTGSVTDLLDPAGYFTARPPGNDVSYYQCSGSASAVTLPADAAFGILNPTAGGLAFSGVSPCLPVQDSWAQQTGDEEFYLALSDRGPSSAHWPGTRTSPQACTAGANSPGCAYDFGYDQAQDVYADAAGTGHAQTHWWLDVETSAPWQSSTSQNAQVVAGAVAYLQAQGAGVGLYSTTAQWSQLLGAATYPGLPEWYATAGRTDAQLVATCSTPFAGGAVSQAQDGSSDQTVLDRDLRC